MLERHDIVVCSNCWQPLGNISRQLVLLSRQVTRADFEDEVPPIPDDHHLSDVIPCENRCGELYCSVVCQENHYSRCHKLLCVGNIAVEDAPTHPLIEFKMNSIETNEIFLLVADVVATIAVRQETLGAESNIQNACAPFSSFVQNPWWEVAISQDGDEATASLREVLTGLVAESCGLLRRAIPGTDKFLTDEYFAKIVGMFEQNNVGIRLTSPVALYFKQLLDSRGKSTEEACELLFPLVSQVVQAIEDAACFDDEDDEEEQEGKEQEEEEESEVDEYEDGDDDETKDTDSTSSGQLRQLIEEHDSEELSGYDVVFPPLDGTALYSLICKMNHSCDPSCIIEYTIHPPYGLVAQVRALRSIAAGEELTQSYVDASLPVEERQAALKDYGFQCYCSKCAAEQL